MMKKILIPLALLMLLVVPTSGIANSSDVPLQRLDEGIPITDWYILGPFHSGSREPLANPIGSAFNRDTGEVDLIATYPSVLQFGGVVSWQPKSVDGNGNLVFSFDNPDWDKINGEWGVSGMIFSAAAYTAVECDYACEALVNARRIGSFYINGRWYQGDPYGHGVIRTPVILDEGENHIFFMTGGWAGNTTVRFEIFPASETELIPLEKDILVPDIVRGERHYGLAAVPVLNTTNRWIEVELGDANEILPPLTVINIPTSISVPDSDIDWEEDGYDVPFEIVWDGGSFDFTASARLREPEESRIITFISRIDNSVQKYGINYPTDYDPEKEYSLIFSTHGASVECEGQVNAFEKKTWAFVVAPTNRRPFGFDWQDWGRLDAMEILDLCMEKYPIDPDRVYLVGHSMGGHGAWHIGCTHADRFAAVVPSAGWESFQLYTPWFLRSDHLFADPNCTRIFEQCTSPDRSIRLLPNLRNVPVLAVHGADDDDVPPTHARLLTGTLERMDYDVRLWEEPDTGHWWDNNKDVPGTDCVDALRIRSFCRERVRNPFPRHVTFQSYDLGNSNSMYWITVHEEFSPIGRIYVDAELTRDRSLVITTENVRRFTISFPEWSDMEIPSDVIIDGWEVDMSYWDSTKTLPMVSTGVGWMPGYDNLPELRKSPEFRGPIKRAYFRPFKIVVGQSGTQEQNDLNMEIARYIAQRWWYRANGYTNIVTDSSIPKGITDEDYNLILIGGPDSNCLSAEYASGLPIQIEEDGIWLGYRWIEGDDLACQFVYPNPDTHGNLIHCIWGNSLDGMRLSGGLCCLYSGSNLPDFLVYDDEVRLMGYAGVRAAGFFGNEWDVDEDYMYLRR